MLFTLINNKIKKQGFQQQLSFSFIISFICLTISITLCALFFCNQLVSENFHKQAMVITRLFAQQSNLALAYASKESAREISHSILGVTNIQQVAMFDSQHTLFYQNGNIQPWHIADLPINKISKNQSPILEFEDNDYWQFIDSVYIQSNNENTSPYDKGRSDEFHLGYVRVLISKAALHAIVEKMVVGITAMAFIILILMLMLQRKIIQEMTTPLYKLIHSMDAVRKKTNWHSPKTSGAPEWQQIFSAFNQMMKSLRENEQELKQKRDEALEASRLKSEFAANISHELRTPMNGIMGTMELLGTMPLDKRQRHYVDLAQSSGKQLHLLINDILDFSKLDAGFMIKDTSPFNLIELVEELITLHAYSEQAADLHLDSYFDHDMPETIQSDMTLLRQLLNNLIGNAVKFTSRGSVYIKMQILTKNLSGVCDDCIMQLTVCDTGIGIAPKHHRRIFDPYSQQDGSTSRKFGGTGLGLAICQRIVNLLKGSIKVESDEGQGSRFIIDLPLTSANYSKENSPDYVIEKYIRQTLFVIALTTNTLVKKSLGCRLKKLGVEYRIFDKENMLASYIKSINQKHILILIDTNEATTPVSEHQISLTQKDSAEPFTIINKNIDVVQLVDASIHRDLKQCNDYTKTIEKPITTDSLIQSINHLIPINNQPAPLVDAPSLPNASFSQFNILIVEDNVISKKVAFEMLKKLGIKADQADDGYQAIKAVTEKHYDLVFMDCQMPVIDGYLATTEIRKKLDLRHLPIVALTANTSNQDIDRCKAAGMSDHLAKPVNLKQMQTILERWLTTETSLNTHPVKI